MKRIIFENEEGGVSVIIPAPNCGLTIEQIAQKDVPKGKDYEIVDTVNIPSDRYFRNAWRKNGKAVEVDMTKAVEIQKNVIRAERAPILADLDVQYMRAMEKVDTARQAEMATEKQALRDATKHPNLVNAATPKELKIVTLDKIRGK